MNITEREIKEIQESVKPKIKDKRKGRSVYPDHYKTDESKPHSKLEKERVRKFNEDGRTNHLNEYNKTRLPRTCGFGKNRYFTALNDFRSDNYFDLIYQIGKKLDVSIDYLINRNSNENVHIQEEADVKAKLDEMGVDERVICLSVWAFFGLYKLRVMLNDS